MLTTAFIAISGLVPALNTKDRSRASPAPTPRDPPGRFFNPELDQMVAELKAEKNAALAREKQLDELAARLRAERAELDEALKGIKKIQSQVDQDVFRIRENETAISRSSPRCMRRWSQRAPRRSSVSWTM